MTDPSSSRDSSELAHIRQTLRKTMQRFGPDYWRTIDAERAFPGEFFELMASAGFFGTMIPADLGGSAAGPTVASVVVEEINRAGGEASTINAQMSICGTLVRAGSDEQLARYVPGIASGDIRMLTVAATEPDSGADMSQLESTTRRDGDGWVLEARKVLISMAEHTRLMILLVRSDEGPTLFLLDLDEVGDAVEIRPVELITNRLTSVLFIDELRVPDSARLGPAGGGLKSLMQGFAVRRTLAASESLGNARFMLERSLEHAKERVTFGRPIGQNQGVQYPLTQAYGRIEAADLMRWDALRLIDEQAKGAAGRAALAKVLASEAAWETARAALTTFGGWGLASEYHVERKLREATVFVFNNLLTSYIAERVLGLPKSF